MFPAFPLTVRIARTAVGRHVSHDVPEPLSFLGSSSGELDVRITGDWCLPRYVRHDRLFGYVAMCQAFVIQRLSFQKRQQRVINTRRTCPGASRQFRELAVVRGGEVMNRGHLLLDVVCTLNTIGCFTRHLHRG